MTKFALVYHWYNQDMFVPLASVVADDAPWDALNYLAEKYSYDETFEQAAEGVSNVRIVVYDVTCDLDIPGTGTTAFADRFALAREAKMKQYAETAEAHERVEFARLKAKYEET